MGVFWLMTILVIGFVYTSNEPRARFKKLKSNGWETYFLVAAHGFLFSFLGGLGIFILMFLLNFVSFLVEVVVSVFSSSFTISSWGSDLFNYHLTDHFVLGSFFSLLLAVAMAAGSGIQSSRKIAESNDNYLAAYREIAKSDGLEKLIFDSMDQNLLVLITLKSRKAYVGKVQNTRFMTSDYEYVVILPMISGYREKDTLRFIEVHSYSGYYEEHKISENSKPLKYDDFRTVIPRTEIETLSLFDPVTFGRFTDMEADSTNEGAVPTA